MWKRLKKNIYARVRRGDYLIFIVSGLIGSGKTTYAKDNKKKEDILLDWDMLKEAYRTSESRDVKISQIQLALLFLKKGYNVWYTTCFPTSAEIESFAGFEKKYIWINTLQHQCVKNIKIRNRGDEVHHIEQLKKNNKNLYSRYLSSDFHFDIVNVFPTNEKW